MNNSLSREQIVDLLKYLGASKIKDREGKRDIMFTCTVHGESNPSAGINVETGVFNCFSCHASGGIESLVMQSLPEEFKTYYDVDKFIMKRYGVDLSLYDFQSAKELRRYEDEVEAPKRIELPPSFIAPYKSGKETYKYFFDRGFTKETLANFKIGRDLISKTVTVPLYYADDVLAGVVGRYIDPNRRKNERYKIYAPTNTGDLVFPANKCEPINGVLIVVEGLLDALYMHQLGYTNTFATLTNAISNKQLRWLKTKHAHTLLDMTDNDDMGLLATDILNKKVTFMTVKTIRDLYPEGCKDPQDMTKDQVDKMIGQALTTPKKRVLRRK